MSSKSSSPAASPINPADYSHSPVHYAVAVGDHTSLSRLLSTLPVLPDPSLIHSESDSLSHERISDQISAFLDRRDVPFRETPLHLSVRLNDSFAARALGSAGADVSLQNSAGWNPLQEALCRRLPEMSSILLRLHHRSAWGKWRSRLPRLVGALRRMPDFYMEVSFQFESSVIPFLGKMAPSDTYKIWKREGNVRADTSLAGFEGMKIQRAEQSFLFLGDGEESQGVAPGSLLVLNREERKIHDAFETAGAPLSESDIAGFCSQTSSVYRPGMDVTKAQLVGRTNWRRQDKCESVGEWKARVYQVHNVVFSFRSRKLVFNSEQEVVLPLELDEDDDGFLVAENPSPSLRRRHSSFVREDTAAAGLISISPDDDRELVLIGRKSVDIIPSSAAARRKSTTTLTHPTHPTPVPLPFPLQSKEKEYVRSLRPSVWLTDHFPLKTEELLPLLDILANKVKAVRRMRELLTTKFPPGTFPVKVAIPVVPTVRVVITFTKFVELQPAAVEQFYTPLSSPCCSNGNEGRGEEEYKSQNPNTRSATSSRLSWLRRNSNSNSNNQPSSSKQEDPFTIPNGYTWSTTRSSALGGDDDKSSKFKKSKSVIRRTSKQAS